MVSVDLREPQGQPDFREFPVANWGSGLETSYLPKADLACADKSMLSGNLGSQVCSWRTHTWLVEKSTGGCYLCVWVEPADAIGQQAGSMSEKRVGHRCRKRVRISLQLPAIMRHKFPAFKASRLSQRRHIA